MPSALQIPKPTSRQTIRDTSKGGGQGGVKGRVQGRVDKEEINNRTRFLLRKRSSEAEVLLFAYAGIPRLIRENCHYTSVIVDTHGDESVGET
jgi:hypothetical protein